MELELGKGFAGAEAEVGEVDDAVGGGPFGGLSLGGGRACRGHGHGLAVGGGGEKECGCNEETGDTWGHLDSRGLRIEDSVLSPIRKAGETVRDRVVSELETIHS